MRQVVLDAVDRALERLAGKGRRKLRVDAGALALIAQPLEDEPRVWPPQRCVANAPQQVRLRIAVERDVIDVTERHAGLYEAIADRFGRKPRPMLDAPETLLFRRRNDFAITDDASRRVAMVGVEAEN